MNIFSPRCLASEASCTDVFKKPAPSTWSSVQMFAPPPRKKSGTYLKCAICKCWHMDITRTHHHHQDSRHAHLSHPSSGQPAICLPSPCISLRFLEFYIGEGNGTPLQYSCLENPMDGGAWWAAVHGVAKSRAWLRDSLSFFTFMHWRRKWQPTAVFLPGESQGRGSLVGCRLWGRTELDMTEVA